MNLRDVLGEEDFEHQRVKRFMPEKYRRRWLSDGVYDQAFGSSRVVVIDGMDCYIMQKSWIESGGPENLPDEITKPAWGSFPDPADLKPKK